MTPADQLRTERIRADRERLQRQFRLYWQAIPEAPAIASEAVLFEDAPRWRYDFANHVAKVAIEVQGGIWRAKGAHNTGTAILRDTRKSRFAQLRGWHVLPICSEDITLTQVEGIARFIRERAIQMAEQYKEAKG